MLSINGKTSHSTQPCCTPARIEKRGERGEKPTFAANAKAPRLEQRYDLRLGETLGQFLARNPSHCIIHCHDHT